MNLGTLRKKIINFSPGLFHIIHIIAKPILSVAKYPKNKAILDRQYNHDVKEIQNVPKELPKIIYFGIPAHSNLGDQAQTFFTNNWLEKHFSDYTVVHLFSLPIIKKKRKMSCMLKEIINNNDIILFQSGYTTIDHHGDHKMHKIIVDAFPENEIVFMPQTVNLKSKKEIQQSAQIFNRHKHIVFVSRDMVSYNKARKMFPSVKHYVCPDIVTTYIGKYNRSFHREGILYCMRDDDEQLIDKSKIDFFMSNSRNNYFRVEKWDTTIDDDYARIQNDFANYLNKILNYISSFKLVVTDRFHGTIFSIISQTPVIVLPTNDHKVTTGADWFIEDYPYMIKKISDIDSLDDEISELLEKTSYQSSDIFEKKYFDHLAEIIKENRVLK